MWIKFNFKKAQSFLLDTAFPKFCFLCQKEGSYLCQDCQGTIEISEQLYCLCQEPVRLPQIGKCQKCKGKALGGLYFGTTYQSNLTKKIIHHFKYEPFIKELKEILIGLIKASFALTGKEKTSFADFLIIPVPLDIKRLKWRGFNQAEEIGKELSNFLEIPLINDVLFKIRSTPPQIELSGSEREENIKEVFSMKNPEKIRERKILLADDVYTTGATMEEAAKVLKMAGAKIIYGIVIARG